VDAIEAPQGRNDDESLTREDEEFWAGLEDIHDHFYDT
jgi:hypothetical protein